MRKDMSKVIVERPRKYNKDNKGTFRNKLKEEKEDEETIRSSMKIRNGCTKELDENLNPLIRFLRSNVGKQWNSVYSDICKNIRPTNEVQRHVLQHVKWEVETGCFTDENGIVLKSNGELFNPYSYRDSFYVDQSGILKLYSRQSFKKRHIPYHNPVNDLIPKEKELEFFYKIDKFWYEVKLSKISNYSKYDYITKTNCYLYTKNGEEKLNGKPFIEKQAFNKYDEISKRYLFTFAHSLVCTFKRQLDKKEIKRYKLK